MQLFLYSISIPVSAFIVHQYPLVALEIKTVKSGRSFGKAQRRMCAIIRTRVCVASTRACRALKSVNGLKKRRWIIHQHQIPMSRKCMVVCFRIQVGVRIKLRRLVYVVQYVDRCILCRCNKLSLNLVLSSADPLLRMRSVITFSSS